MAEKTTLLDYLASLKLSAKEPQGTVLKEKIEFCDETT